MPQLDPVFFFTEFFSLIWTFCLFYIYNSYILLPFVVCCFYVRGNYFHFLQQTFVDHNNVLAMFALGETQYFVLNRHAFVFSMCNLEYMLNCFCLNIVTIVLLFVSSVNIITKCLSPIIFVLYLKF